MTTKVNSLQVKKVIADITKEMERQGMGDVYTNRQVESDLIDSFFEQKSKSQLLNIMRWGDVTPKMLKKAALNKFDFIVTL